MRMSRMPIAAHSWKSSGAKTQNFAHLIRNTPFKWLVMFTHIPMNMIRRSVEYSPLAALNMLGETKMGSAIKGELGTHAQNLALAKMTIGSAVGAYFIEKALSGQATGDYPTDPTERRRWAIEGIQPNSIQANGQWMSLERLGPQATVARIAANYADVIKHYDGSDDDAFMKASLAMVLGTANALASTSVLRQLRTSSTSWKIRRRPPALRLGNSVPTPCRYRLSRRGPARSTPICAKPIPC